MRTVYLLIAVSLLISSAQYAHAIDQRLTVRKKLWQNELESRPFVFLKEERGLIKSLEHYSAHCQLNIVVDPLPEQEQQNYRMSLNFVREGKNVLTLRGDTEIHFRTIDEKLYIADAGAQGCIVSAYDLTDGKELWTTKDISGLKRGGASAYGNQIKMRLSRPNEVQDEAKEAAIVVTGSEGFGAYITVIDRETGIMLAHKIYSAGTLDRAPDYERAGGIAEPR